MSPGAWLVFLLRNLICQQVMKLSCAGCETPGHSHQDFRSSEPPRQGPKALSKPLLKEQVTFGTKAGTDSLLVWPP